MNRFRLSFAAGCCDGGVYETKLPKLPRGLYFLRFELATAYGEYVSYRTNGFLSFKRMADDAAYDFQILISDFLYPKPNWIYGGIVYHVFVDRFFRGSDTPPSCGGYFNPDWNNGIPEYPAYPGAPLKNNMFFGGNLDGVRLKLPYIASLGVNCIYLSPVFRAASNHKYDTGDYMTVDEAFGGDEALLRLIAEAEDYDITVILDGVFNHTGDDSIYFNKYGHYGSIGAYQSQNSPYYAWYDFESFPDRYRSWWGIDILPRINPDFPACRSFFIGDGGVVQKWMQYGIGGFRLDVADELSDEFIAEIKASVNSIKSDAILYGEVWEDASNKIAYGKRRAYYDGIALDGVMNYPVRTGIVRYLRHGETEALAYALTDVTENAPKRIRDAQMNLLGTHDTVRIITALAGEEANDIPNKILATKRMTEEERLQGKRLLALAYLILATLPGVPAIFYGDEIGMEGYGDPFNRRPFPWHRMEEKLLSVYREIGKLRRAHSVYREGEFRLLHLSADLLAFVRESGSNAYVTLVSRETKSCSFTLPPEATVLYGAPRKSDTYVLPPLSGVVLRMNKENIPN